MPRQTLYLWKQAPFLRLLAPLMAGILIQWHIAPFVQLAWAMLIIAIAALLLFNYRLFFLQYKLAWVNGILINIL